MLRRLHLVRHGEVANPGGVVYADLPGFRLSKLGERQAADAAARLSDSTATIVLSSPLDRAVETATIIGQGLGVDPITDGRLGEWSLSGRWAGTPWVDLPSRFPGELEAYLADPSDLPFAPESLADVARRMLAAIEDPLVTGSHAVAVVVSHQDPIQALRLSLVGRPLSTLRSDPPDHASIISLEHTEGRWAETGVWSPPA